MLGDSVSCKKKKKRIFELFQELENFISALWIYFPILEDYYVLASFYIRYDMNVNLTK